MSTESRSPLRLRRGAAEPDRPDYSEPDFSSWAARLDEFTTAHVDEQANAPAAPAAAAPAAPDLEAVKDDRPSLEAVLEKLLAFDGSIGVALVDSESGMVLGEAGSVDNLGLSAAGAAVILRSRLATNKALGLNEKIDDVLISLSSQVQIIHPLANNPKFFVYMIGDKSKSSLAMARYKATEADQHIQL
jgi:hypothetical protein